MKCGTIKVWALDCASFNEVRVRGGNMIKSKFTRSAGILMPVSSLPSPYGIGTFGKEAYEFVDFVDKTNHKYWQVLPLGPTTYGDSPYQSYSANAGNPYFIDLDKLIEEKLLLKSEVLARDWGDGIVPIKLSEEDALNNRYQLNIDPTIGDSRYVSYEKMYLNRFDILRLAYNRFKESVKEDKIKTAYEKFLDRSKWLTDYALFMALKVDNNFKSWADWEEDLRRRKPEALDKKAKELEDEIDFWKFIQFKFYEQWDKLKEYANNKGIEIIGDIPIYMGYDSVDVWANQEQFQLDKDLVATKVAGVPPDDFSADGQKWGNPLYDWDRMKKDNYTWWRNRIKWQTNLYDVIRIDHFLGIVKYYAVPEKDKTAVNGEYREGPGQALLDAINEELGDKKLIAEDLGVYLPEVNELLTKNAYPGMKVLEFAFGGSRDNPHLPYNYEKNCVVYGGTHDNETIMGFFKERSDEELAYAFDYLGTRDRNEILDKVFRAAYSSVSVLTIFAVWDILGLDNHARMNMPSSTGSNWKWRLTKGQLNESHINTMRYYASVFDREK